MSSPFPRAALRHAVQLIAGIGLLGIVTPATPANAQGCRLEYQRAPSATAAYGATLGVEHMYLGANQQQELITDWKYESARGTGVVRYGSHLRSAINQGAEPIALGLLGPAVGGLAIAPGSDVAHAIGGVSGGVTVTGGLSGGVVNDRANNRSWILLQAGERASDLQHDLAAAACGSSNPIVRAVTDVLLRAPSGTAALSAKSGRGSR